MKHPVLHNCSANSTMNCLIEACSSKSLYDIACVVIFASHTWSVLQFTYVSTFVAAVFLLCTSPGTKAKDDDVDNTNTEYWKTRSSENLTV